ncbi:MAG: ABC transporter permease, partial [Burkholderiales bacterium]
MSSVLVSPQLTPSAARARGVWSAAATRFRTDKVGMTSLVIVVLFLLVVLAAGLGLVAKDWQVERGVPDAPPTFVG